MPLRGELQFPLVRINPYDVEDNCAWLLIIFSAIGFLASVLFAAAGFALG